MTKPFQVEITSGYENDDRDLLAGGAPCPSALTFSVTRVAIGEREGGIKSTRRMIDAIDAKDRRMRIFFEAMSDGLRIGCRGDDRRASPFLIGGGYCRRRR
jgi:hypothetical protein